MTSLSLTTNKLAHSIFVTKQQQQYYIHHQETKESNFTTEAKTEDLSRRIPSAVNLSRDCKLYLTFRTKNWLGIFSSLQNSTIFPHSFFTKIPLFLNAVGVLFFSWIMGLSYWISPIRIMPKHCRNGSSSSSHAEWETKSEQGGLLTLMQTAVAGGTVCQICLVALPLLP